MTLLTPVARRESTAAWMESTRLVLIPTVPGEEIWRSSVVVAPTMPMGCPATWIRQVRAMRLDSPEAAWPSLETRLAMPDPQGGG